MRNGKKPDAATGCLSHGSIFRILKAEHQDDACAILRIGDLNTAPVSPRRSLRGFTMIELMIVMSIIVILVSIALPLYQKSILRARESVLKNNLFTIRTVIDEYTYDKEKAPQSLEDLVTEGYLREVPIDPMTSSNTSWRVIMEDAMQSVNQTEPGIFDVRSGSDKIGLDGTPYSEW